MIFQAVLMKYFAFVLVTLLGLIMFKILQLMKGLFGRL